MRIVQSTGRTNKRSLRKTYRFIPRSAWAELDRLKREEGFCDLATQPVPGEPALFRFMENRTTREVESDLIIIARDGRVLRYRNTLRLVKSRSRRAA